LSIYNLKKVIIIGVISVTFFLGCASNVPMATSSKDSIAKSFKKDGKYANVYLCRNSFGGSALNYSVLVDGKLARTTSGYSFLYLKMKPGKHIIQSKHENTFSLTLNTKTNTNYFIIQELVSSSDTKLSIVDEEQGKKCVLATKMLKSQLHTSSYPHKTSTVKPSYVSPIKYQKYSCNQLSKEREKISQRITILSTQLENFNTKKGAMVFTSPLIFLPIGLSSTSEIEVELGKLNGEYNALTAAAKHKKCKL